MKIVMTDGVIIALAETIADAEKLLAVAFLKRGPTLSLAGDDVSEMSWVFVFGHD